jgi:hypothetical protein
MLNLQAVFERKSSEFPVRDCVIEKIAELPEEEYRSYRSNLIRDAGFIAENKDLMYADGNGIQHCLLVLGQNCSEGVLIQSEGYDYARYASLLPGARDFVTARLNELADQIIRESTQNTSNSTWAVYFDELKEKYKVSIDSANGIGSMLLGILESRPEMAEVEPMEDGYDMTFYLDYCQNLDEKEKFSSGIPDDVFRLKDLIRVPIEDFHLVHREVDMEPATIAYLDSDTLTDAGKQEWGDILNAQVVRVFQGIYGIQAECAGVDPQRLADFSLILAGNCTIEDYETWVRQELDKPGMILKL